MPNLTPAINALTDRLHEVEARPCQNSQQADTKHQELDSLRLAIRILSHAPKTPWGRFIRGINLKSYRTHG